MSYKLSLGLLTVVFTTSDSFTIMSSSTGYPELLDFIEQAHPKTIDWIVREHLDGPKRVDQLTKMQQAMADIRALNEEYYVN